MRAVSVMLAGLVLMLSQALVPANAGWNPDKKKPTTTEEVQETIAAFLDQDSGLQKFFDNAHGYAVFPKIYKGAIGVGGGTRRQGSSTAATSISHSSFHI